MSSLNEKPVALAQFVNNNAQPAAKPQGLKAFFLSCLADLENSYVETIKGYQPDTLADLVGQKPQLVTKPSLLKGEFSLCSHPTGFWYGTAKKVSDESGEYIRFQGPCKRCEAPLFSIHEPK